MKEQALFRELVRFFVGARILVRESGRVTLQTSSLYLLAFVTELCGLHRAFVGLQRQTRRGDPAKFRGSFQPFDV